jgi:hypothetical protein
MIAKNSLQAGEANFYETFREMFLSFDMQAVDDAIGSWLRTSGYRLVGPKLDEGDVQDVFEIGFSELYNRGAIAAVRPLSVAGQKQLEALTDSRQRLEIIQAAPDPLAELIADNANLPASQFKAKWLVDPNRRAIYEGAIEAGQIV